MPSVDVFEKDDKFVVKTDLPGMKEEDIDVSVVSDTLTIKGEKKEEAEVKEEDYYRCERAYAAQHRTPRNGQACALQCFVIKGGHHASTTGDCT